MVITQAHPFYSKLAAIATSLGTDWSEVDAKLVHKDGYSIFFNTNYLKSKADRIYIVGSYHQDLRVYMNSNSGYSISVNKDRSAQAIALAITSRLLPDYVPSYKRTVARRDAGLIAENRTKAVVVHLHQLVEPFATHNFHSKSEVDCIYPELPNRKAIRAGMSVCVYSNDEVASVDFKISNLNVEEAEQLAIWLNGLNLPV